MEKIGNNIENLKFDSIKLEHNGKEFEIKFKTINFEYPEKIQKETGILGYERKIIATEDIEKLHELFSINGTGSREDRKFIYSEELLMKLSNNRFPAETFTYQMMDERKSTGNLEQFADDKFILQNVFDMDSPAEKRKSTYETSTGDASIDTSVFDIYDKKSKKIIKRGEARIIDNYENEVKNNEVAIVSGNGLNVCEISFWAGYNILDKKAVFGFDRQDKLFQDYLTKSINFLRELNTVNKLPAESFYMDDSFGDKKLSFYEPRTYGNRLFLELFSMKESENSKKYLQAHGYDGVHALVSGRYPEFKNFLIKKYGSAFDNNAGDMFDHLKLKEEYSDDYDVYSKHPLWRSNEREDLGFYGAPGRQDSQSYHVPVFINSDEVKQLKWGHASNAVFWTKNGFNCLNIKHADKFPEVNKENK